MADLYSYSLPEYCIKPCSFGSIWKPEPTPFYQDHGQLFKRDMYPFSKIEKHQTQRSDIWTKDSKASLLAACFLFICRQERASIKKINQRENIWREYKGRINLVGGLLTFSSILPCGMCRRAGRTSIKPDSRNTACTERSPIYHKRNFRARIQGSSTLSEKSGESWNNWLQPGSGKLFTTNFSSQWHQPKWSSQSNPG